MLRAGPRLGGPVTGRRFVMPPSRALRAEPAMRLRPSMSGSVGVTNYDSGASPLPYTPPGSLTSGFAYQSDSLFGQELGSWSPWLRSPDSEINDYRDRRVGRTRDVVRNDGWATGGVTRIADNTIGSLFRLISRPDHRALARASGAAFDATWASEFAELVESEWRLWSDDPGHWCDAARQLTMTQLFYLSLQHKLRDGENLAVLEWRPDAIGEGGARYATAYKMIDPDRLSNPFSAPDTETLRGGVEIDADGAPVAYHMRRAHQNDMFAAEKSVVWDRVARETEWGRPIVVHDFDRDRTAQNRGLSVLNPVLSKLKMLGRYDAAELQQALLQTVIGTFVVSPYDSQQMQNALDASPGQPWEMSAYQDLRSDFHTNRPLMLGDTRIPTLAPGERIDSIPPRSPTTNFADFEHAVLRNVASAMGVSAEQISGDYSRANYSSLRASMLEVWRTMQRRRSDFGSNTATPIYGGLLEEIVDRHPEALPRGAPAFIAQRAAYMRHRWIGPGRGWVDPVKERQGAVLGLDAGFGTLQDECAEIAGADWREQLDQRAIEVARFKELGLKPPEWSGLEPAAQTTTRPQPV